MPVARIEARKGLLATVACSTSSVDANTMSMGGKQFQTEEYSDWKVDAPLSPALFDISTWSTAPHWAKQK